MKPLRSSNYDIMRDCMELEFAKYDQMEMIRKFSLLYDKDFFIFALSGRIIEFAGNHKICLCRRESVFQSKRDFAGNCEALLEAWRKCSCAIK